MRKALLVLLSILLVTLPLTSFADDNVVNVFNWEEYICEDAIKLFEQETGISVNYMNFTNNEDMLPQVRNSPAQFDVVFPSDYAIERMIVEDLLQPINYDNIPNIKYINSNLLKPDYDPTGEYSIPYMWGTVGILYNTKMVEEVPNSWESLFDSKNQNNVFMQLSVRDSMGVALKSLGYSMNSLDPYQLNEAKERLIKQKKDGIVKAYQYDEIKDKMVLGEAALAVVYSGDAQYAIDLNSDLAYVVPMEGSNIWVDGMVIPKAAKHRENAEKFIDFICRPDVAAMNCQEIWYSTPNIEAETLMGEIYTDNLTINPTQDIIDRCEFFKDVGDFLTVYNTMWEQVVSSK